MGRTKRVVRAATYTVVLLGVAAFSLAMWLAGCSLGSERGSGHERVASQGERLTGPVTITLVAPNSLTPITPVMEGLNSVSLGSSANVVSGTTVAMGTGGLPDVEPGAALNDVWSRGPVALRDRVNIRGTLHASTVTLGNGDTITARDTTPVLDPVSRLSWTVTYPSGTGQNITLGSGQSQTIAPGLYGSFTLNSQSTLNLQTGTYYFTDFVVNSQVTVNLNQTLGPVIIYVANTLILRGAFVPTGGSDGGVVHPDLFIGYLGTNQLFVESLFDGAIAAPFATLTLRQVSGIHTGFFAAKDINNLDSTVQVQYRTPTALVAAANPPGFSCPKLLAGAVPPQLIPRYCRTSNTPDDTDHDGVSDGLDECPYDHFKKTRGICGCNVPDIDSDGDGVPDCIDQCPNDPNKVVPGQCGCAGVPGLKPAGFACTDTACPQTGATCNGAGVCGNPATCNPCPPNGRLINDVGISYWLCGVSIPPETGPDGGTENITTGSTASETTAQSNCSSKGLTLTRIDTPDRNRQIARLISAPLWLGANDLQTNGQWRWSVPGNNSGDLFWVGGPTGTPQNNLYANWGAGAPGSTNLCAAMAPGDGHWFDTNCNEPLGYICQFQPPPQGLPVDAGVRLPGPRLPVPMPTTACVNEFDLDAGGLPDSLAELINEVDAARHGNFFGVAAHPPPDGSVCPAELPDARPTEVLGLVPDSGAGCSLTNAQQIFSTNNSADGGAGFVDCITDDDCANALDASFVCRTLKDNSGCQPPDASPDSSITLDGGNACIGHSVCGQLVCNSVVETCSEVRICKSNTDFDAGLDPGSILDAGPFNTATMFDGAPPDAAESPQYSDPPMFNGAAHTWCHMDLQNPVGGANQPAQGTNGSSGQGTSINITFDPNLVFAVNANPLAFGENSMGVHGAASLKATVHLHQFLGQDYTADIVNIGAGVKAARCNVNNDETVFTVLGIDVISALGLGIPHFNSADLLPPQTEACNNAVANFSLWANRAKKAFRDAQQLLAAYKDITSHGNLLSNTLCKDIMSAVNTSDVEFFPGGLICPDGEPVEMTINRFVDYLQAPGTGQISQVRQAASDLVNKSTAVLETAIPKIHANLLDLQRDESQTILNVPFAIGPVPMVLQVDVFAGYGINGQFNLEMHTPLAQIGNGLDNANPTEPGQPNVTPIPIAHLKVEVIPWAAAGLSAFVGAGVDLGAFSATVGIEGRVTLGQVSAPIFAGAGLDLLEEVDHRPIPPDIGPASVIADNLAGPLFQFSAPKSFNFLVWFEYGAGIQLTDILSGEINGKLHISFFFFSHTWRVRIVKFNGWSAFFNLTSGTISASTTKTNNQSLGSSRIPPPQGQTTVVTVSDHGGPSMGRAEAQLPLTILQTLPVPDAAAPMVDAGAPDVQVIGFDAAGVQTFFYDNQCCVKNGTDPCVPKGAGVPQCCPDYTCVLPQPDASTGNCQIVCIQQGAKCRAGAVASCCSGLQCANDNTCEPACLPSGSSCDPNTANCCADLECVPNGAAGNQCL